jgi:hypothetical protein
MKRIDVKVQNVEFVRELTRTLASKRSPVDTQGTKFIAGLSVLNT